MTKDEWIKEALPFLIILADAVQVELNTRGPGLTRNLVQYSQRRLTTVIHLGQLLLRDEELGETDELDT